MTRLDGMILTREVSLRSPRMVRKVGYVEVKKAKEKVEKDAGRVVETICREIARKEKAKGRMEKAKEVDVGLAADHMHNETAQKVSQRGKEVDVGRAEDHMRKEIAPKVKEKDTREKEVCMKLIGGMEVTSGTDGTKEGKRLVLRMGPRRGKESLIKNQRKN